MAGHSVRQMSDLDEYTMLIASLPHHGPLFAAKRTPINRVKLERRLKILRPDHYESLTFVVNALLWYALPLGLQETGAPPPRRRNLAAGRQGLGIWPLAESHRAQLVGAQLPARRRLSLAQGGG